MKILIAGFGSIGRRHFRNLLALGEQNILFYRTRRSTLPDDETRKYPVFTDLEKALAEQPDGVIVSNPTAYHLDVAIPAAEAGCRILLEKPVSHTMARIPELRNLVEENGGEVLVGYQFRYHPGLQKVKALLEEKAIGKLLSVVAHWGEYLPGWHPWEDYRKGYSARADLGGGVVLTLSHPLDYLHWLMGEVVSVFGVTERNNELGIDVESAAVIGLKFENGVLGSVTLDYNQRPPMHRLEITGSHGTIRWNNADGVVAFYRAGENSTDGWVRFSPPEGFQRNDLFLIQMRHFLNVVRGDEKPVCALDDGVKALKIALAVHQSAKTKRMVIV